jgi:hypothetical protein
MQNNVSYLVFTKLVYCLSNYCDPLSVGLTKILCVARLKYSPIFSKLRFTVHAVNNLKRESISSCAGKLK